MRLVIAMSLCFLWASLMGSLLSEHLVLDILCSFIGGYLIAGLLYVPPKKVEVKNDTDDNGPTTR